MNDVVSKLHDLDEAKTIYDIHRCRAGWGIIFYYPELADDDHWREGLSVEKYYPTFEEMVEKEWLRLKGNKKLEVK